MTRTLPALLLAVLLALPGCDVRDSLVSVLEVRPAYSGDAAAPPGASAERVVLVRSAAEEAAVRASFGIAAPFAGVDYRTDVVAVVGRPLPAGSGRLEIDRVELRGQREVVVRSRAVGSSNAPARYAAAAAAVDRFSEAFTDVRGDFR